ncbi:MAG: hypothetical protein KGJ13_06365 [Patescibacteria group bacterium]|nr:hypothetical protein [Patescibacteria group bacterium]
MADQTQALIDSLAKLNAKLDVLAEFAQNWKLREQQPGLFSKLPVTIPWRPISGRTRIMALGVADIFITLEEGLYDLSADNDCFITLNGLSSITTGYLLRAGLVYGGLRIIARDDLHVIAAAAGGNLYVSPVG